MHILGKGASPNYFFHYNVIVTLFLDPPPPPPKRHNDVIMEKIVWRRPLSLILIFS